MIILLQFSYYNRDDQALPGFADFFWKASEEEYKHAVSSVRRRMWRRSKR